MRVFEMCGAVRRPVARRVLAATLSAALSVPLAHAEPKLEKSAKIAPGLYEMVLDPVDNLLYVAAAGTRGKPAAQIAVVDPKSLAVVKTISLGDNPVFGLGINSKTRTLYGTNTRGGSITAVDIATGKVVATIKTDNQKAHLRQVKADEATNTIYATVFGGASRDPEVKPPPSELWIIDGKANTVSHVVSSPVQSATGMALDSKGRKIYVSDPRKNEIGVIDADSRAILHRWPSGGEGTINVEVDPEGGRIFAANQGSGTVTVLNAKDGQIIKSVSTGEGALSVAYSGKLNQIYVANRKAGTVTIVDGKSYDVLANIKTGTLPQTIVVHPSGLVYVTNKAGGPPRAEGEKGKGKGKGKNESEAKSAPPVDDPNGDTVAVIQP